MQKFETLFGSAVWMALSLVMVFAALEPVEVHAAAQFAQGAGAACANPSLLCETNSL